MGDYRYSFSGADARLFAYAVGPNGQTLGNIAFLESAHTISISVHEPKGQARALGFKGIKGFARSIRTIAGSLIMTVIEDNPLMPLLKAIEGRPTPIAWSVDAGTAGVGSASDRFNFWNRLATQLPPFNLLANYVSEGAKFNDIDEDGEPDQVDSLSWLLEGVEIIDSGVVTSVNDIVTEVAYSFIARDFKEIAQQPSRLSRTSVPVLSSDQGRHAQLMDGLFGEN